MTAAMVLCAGFGTRLRPITDSIPKPLLPVGDLPAFLHVLHRLMSNGFAPIAMNTHHRADAFDNWVPQGVTIVHEHDHILGTAGGVANAASVLGRGDVLVWNGDVIAEPDLAELAAAHSNRPESVATLLAAPRQPGHGTLGVQRDGCVARLRGETFGEEVAGGDFLGIQMISAQGRELLPAQGCLVGDVYMPALRRGGRVKVHWYDGAWDDIGSPGALLAANLRWLDRRRRNFWVAPRARVGAGISLRATVVCDDATVYGRGTVERCLVLPGAVLEAPACGVIAVHGTGSIAVDAGAASSP